MAVSKMLFYADDVVQKALDAAAHGETGVKKRGRANKHFTTLDFFIVQCSNMVLCTCSTEASSSLCSVKHEVLCPKSREK